jgi:hypothetical protein
MKKAARVKWRQKQFLKRKNLKCWIHFMFRCYVNEPTHNMPNGIVLTVNLPKLRKCQGAFGLT